MRKTSLAAAAAFIACVLLANYLTVKYGFVPVGFGLYATAGTYAAGASFIARDAVQDTGGRWAVIAVILIGAALSALISPALALASGAAFLLSETADMAVYTPLRDRGYLRAAVASNVVGSVVDTIAFLTIAGFPLWASLPGQIVGKIMVTVVVALVVLTVRGVRKGATA